MKQETIDQLAQMTFPFYRKLLGDHAFMCFLDAERYLYACPTEGYEGIDICPVSDYAFEHYILDGTAIDQEEFSDALQATSEALSKYLPTGLFLGVLNCTPSIHQPHLSYETSII